MEYINLAWWTTSLSHFKKKSHHRCEDSLARAKFAGLA